MKPEPLKNPGPLKPFDERHSVFARARLSPGDGHYERYYELHPDKKTVDDGTRALPNLAASTSRRFSAGEAAILEGQFAASDLVAAAVERAGDEPASKSPDGIGTPSAAAPPGRLEDDSPAALARFVKDAARFLGADDVGITPIDPAFVYSHRGRPIEHYGETVELKHSHAIVLVFRMRHEFVAAAPEMICTTETARVYQQAAAACFALADALKRLGYRARGHVDSNYLLVCPPLGVAAGLGELGRHGLLIHPVYGPEIRLGVVSVDAEIECDGPGNWGISAFCRDCEKCAKMCPPGAIATGEPTVSRGALKWSMAAEKCYYFWRRQGTDCGICLRVCPFAKPDTRLHRIVRATVARTTIFNRLFVKLDDWLYGASREPRNVPRLGD